MSVQQATVKKDVKQKPNLKYMRDKLNEKVTGIFRFYEVAGGGIGFNFREFKEDGIERYDFVDGETYTIPLRVARHLNKNGCYPEYGYVPGSTVKQSGVAADNVAMKVVKKIRRFGLQSLEFVDIDDMPTMPDKEVIQVQTV